jgi:hypothetical protein
VVVAAATQHRVAPLLVVVALVEPISTTAHPRRSTPEEVVAVAVSLRLVHPEMVVRVALE